MTNYATSTRKPTITNEQQMSYKQKIKYVNKKIKYTDNERKREIERILINYNITSRVALN